MSGQLENELEELINKKKEVDRNITQLESQIYNYETSFLEESKTNITRGLDGYLSNRSDRKHYNVKDTDRIFSNSSSTFQKSVSGTIKEDTDRQTMKKSRSDSADDDFEF